MDACTGFCSYCGFMCVHELPKNARPHQCFCALDKKSKQYQIAAKWLKNPWNPPGTCCLLSSALYSIVSSEYSDSDKS
jgi:hypothetical protein